MARERTPLKQVSLPFAEGEAAYAERWNDLGIALLRIPPKQCTAQLAGLVRWIFNMTKGGVDGALTKTYAELAQRPWGLCCDERTARRTVSSARRYGLISVVQQRRWDGSQQCNAYTIDWEGIAALKNGTQRRGADGHNDHRGGHSVQGGGHCVRHIKEFSLIQSFSSDTGPGAAPNPRMDSKTEGSRPRMAASDGRRRDSLTESLLADSPILAAARERRIAPLPAGNLLHGIFAPIKPADIQRPSRFVKWHRMQLSTAVPVMGDTEAELLLTIATAMYARSLPESDVRKNRAAVFVSTIARQAFLKSLPFVLEARTLLDEGIAKLGAAWAGLADEPAEKSQLVTNH